MFKRLRKKSIFLIFPAIIFILAVVYAQDVPVFQSPTDNPETKKCDGKITCYFGEYHKGIDVAIGQGVPLYASADGVVTSIGPHWQNEKDPKEGYGYHIHIDHGNGWVTTYAHLQERSEEVTGNEPVKAGQAKATTDVPANDHPDETYGIGDEVFPPVSGENKHFTVDKYVGVFNEGFSNSASEMVLRNWNAIGLVPIEELVNGIIVEDLKYYPIMIIPTAGLHGLDNSLTFRQKLGDYVSAGGTVIVFAQQHGYEFTALPGGEVSGYGWNEDESCHTNAVYIDTYHPMFAGQDSANLDASVDGYLTQWPSEATILLRRTKNQMPAMVKYGYGQGEVVVLTFRSETGEDRKLL